MMLPCTLHIGAPKTGSTAIQDALFYSLRDPGFQYAAGGESNGSLAMHALFQDPPENEFFFRRFGSPGGSFSAYRQRMGRQLERGVEQAVRRSAHLVVSAEHFWFYPEAIMRRIREYFTDRGFDVQVLGYLRPWESWVTSLLAHRLLYGRGEFVLTSERDAPLFDVVGNVERLWCVFGRDRVHLSKFDPASFPGGCVVRDFFRQLGLTPPSSPRTPVNASATLPAAQLAYCFHRFCGRVSDVQAGHTPGLFRMIDSLRTLPGPQLRLHEELVSPWLEEHQSQDAWLQRELGFSLDASRAGDGPSAVKCETDLFEFAPATLEWLARETGRKVIAERSGEGAARAVAQQVNALRRRRYSPREMAERIASHARKRWVRWRAAC